MWVVANYFHTIDVVKESEDEFDMLIQDWIKDGNPKPIFP